MRKLIVKYLALSYKVTIFGKWGTQPRATSIIFPLFIIFGYFMLNDGCYLSSESSFFTWLFLVLTISTIGITFFYFKFFPVKWEELDEEQKWFFGNGIISNKTKETLSSKQMMEWQSINETILNSNKKFRNVFISQLPIISTIILFLKLFIYG